jgi:hypothetical protein
MQTHLSGLLGAVTCWSIGLALLMTMYRNGTSGILAFALYLMSGTMFGVGIGILGRCRLWVTLLVSWLVSMVFLLIAAWVFLEYFFVL